MRRAYRATLAPIAGVVLALAGCGNEPETSARAFDGAPPVIPHVAFGAVCQSCHGPSGPEVPGLGYAPRSPHEQTAGMQFSRCQQCHVFQNTEGVWRSTTFAGLPQPTAPAHRAHPLAPPTIPHPVFMRENCLACHDGPAARDAIRTSHPERARCRQCHVEPITTRRFHEPSTS
jgi:cytochrome c-type protein NapB